MKRPMLVSGTAIGLSSAFLVFFGIGALPFLLLGAVSVFIIYFIKPLNLREKIIIPTICISVFLSCIFFSAYHFSKITPATKLDNTITDISGKIITTPQETPYGIRFTLKTDKIGNNDKSNKIQVYLNTDYDTELKLYDYISLPDTKLEIVRDEYNKPDASSISDNIIVETQAKYCNSLWESERTPYYYCLRFKEIITEQIKAYLPQYNAGFILGMLFGDKTEIDPDITNDFRATGIAHLLAVSGLHTSVWCGYIIAFLKLFIEIPLAVIETKEGFTLTEDEIIDFCMSLPKYKRPKKYIFEEIPRNPTGKIEKPKLRSIYCGESLVAQQNEIK